jgi:hypothetical protein
MSKIAILAYGSLIWSPRNLKLKGDWQYGGPELPVEFCRITQDGRLVLTVTEEAEPQPTFFAQSAYTDMDKAIANVAQREGCHIHGVCRSDTEKPRFRNWLEEVGFDYALYCSLPVNFQERRQEKLSGSAARRYLDTLDEIAFERAREYIVNAPPEIITPVRQYLLEHYFFKWSITSLNNAAVAGEQGAVQRNTLQLSFGMWDEVRLCQFLTQLLPYPPVNPG